MPSLRDIIQVRSQIFIWHNYLSKFFSEFSYFIAERFPKKESFTDGRTEAQTNARDDNNNLVSTWELKKQKSLCV